MPVTSRSARTGTAPPPRPRPSPPSATPSSARSGSSASPASPPSCAPPDGTLTGSRSSSSASPGPGPRHPHDASPRQKRDPENAARQKPRKPQLRDQHKKRQLRQTATQGPTLQTPWNPVPGSVTVTQRTAGDLASVLSGSQTLVCIDPPYYDNVMYAELSDFFYVWEKRTLGLIYPDLFATELTDKQNEAVTNVARFADMGKRRKELANGDYESKMAAIFAEAERILRDDG